MTAVREIMTHNADDPAEKVLETMESYNIRRRASSRPEAKQARGEVLSPLFYCLNPPVPLGRGPREAYPGGMPPCATGGSAPPVPECRQPPPCRPRRPPPAPCR